MATNNKDFRVKNGLFVEQDAYIGGDLVVNGTITGDGSGLSGVTSYTQTDFDADFATKDTDDLAEGTNLYYTTARFDDALATKDTDDLAEGTNLYYTTARANTDFDSRLALKSTSDLTEGTNQYFTTARARESISITDTGGDGSLSYDNSTGVVTYNGPSASEVRNHFSEGTGVTISNGSVAIGQPVATTDSVTFANVTLSSVPTNSTHAATKQYVDEAAAGLKAAPAVEAATTANLTATYSNGTLGVGATLTATSNGAFPAIDGVTVASTTPGSNGVLVKNQTNAAHNGRYNLTQVGDGSTPWILTKCVVCDEADEIPGSYIFVKAGSTLASTGWVAYVANPSTFVVGTDSITYFQFSGAGTYTAGTGLSLTGTQFSNTGVLSVNSLTGAITATNILDAVKTVDGSGSGLDADTLDGNEASAFYLATNPSGYTTNTGTVTSVGGTGTVSGLTLTGSVTTSGNLTLGGALSLTSSDVTTALGYTPLSSGGGTLTGNLIFANSTSPNSNYIQFGDNTGWQFRFMTSVSGTPTVRYTFADNGNFTAVGNVTAFSDERLKKDWSSVGSDFVSRLAQIKSGTYTRIDSGERQAGVSAQDMQQLLKEVVMEGADEEKTLSIAYGNAALVAAVELAKQVVELKREIELLKAK
jgi:hypothetical protein